MKSYKSIFLCIFCAAILAFSFPSYNMRFLSWIAFIPLFFAVRNKKFIDIFLLGFLTGLIFFYIVINWLNSIAIMATIALVAYLAVYFALFAVFARYMLDINAPVFLKAIFISSWWVVLEFTRSNLLTGFGWALLGYSQAGLLPAIQIADITGVLGVSFIVMFVNVAVYEFFFAKEEPVPTVSRLLRNRLINLLFCILLIASVFLYGFYKLCRKPTAASQQPIKISLIQGNIPQSLKWDDAYRGGIIKRYFDLTIAAARDKPDIIIWPETSFPADLDLEPEIAKGLFNLAKSADTYILVGVNRMGWKDKGRYDKIYNTAYLIGADGNIKQYYDKLHLVPFGEYMPRIPKILYKFLPEKINMVGDFSPGKEYTVFQLSKTVFARSADEVSTTKQSPWDEEIACLPARQASLPSVARKDVGVTFSVLICFEDVFPQISRQMVKNGARMLVNMTNDGWYGVSSAPFQHAQASILRAVENRVPVVRAANTGYSAFIDKEGRVIDKVPPFAADYKTREISTGAYQLTFYNKYPHVFIGISFLLSLIGFGIIFRNSSLRNDMVLVSKIKS